ncbi:NAD-dependent succinate-semialdehyde dehydrogenase [Candidatus Woesearchaeota archaeon]|nr:NAD-dependent succinate-semialdehyde dehydrogenase [Candidatus Woesearchaeota archaeon]
MKIQSVNPYTEQIVESYMLLSDVALEEKVQVARRAFSTWSGFSAEKRASFFPAVASTLRARKEAYAYLMTQEMGKPIREARAEVEKCAWVCDYYAQHGPSFLQEEVIPTEATKSYVRFDSLGVILGVMPWNFPFWQVFRFAVPTMIAGNTCLLKHASNVPGCALAIEDVFSKSGLPPSIFTTLLISAKAVTRLIETDLVDGVSLTGSNIAGEQIGASAGKMIKKQVFELGGSDPFIILEDAHIEAAATTAVKARFLNTGQSCIAAKRFIVMEQVADAFIASFTKAFHALKVGNPKEDTTDIGPLARKEFVQELTAQLADAQSKGAKVIYGPEVPATGFFFQPAMVLGARQGMRVVDEEVFGPIAPFLIVKSHQEAVQLANATPFGLGASIWSRNLPVAEQMASQIQAGSIAINDLVKSDPRLPFGGIKKSGIGRELSSYAIKEFVNVKTVVVQGGV